MTPWREIRFSMAGKRIAALVHYVEASAAMDMKIDVAGGDGCVAKIEIRMRCRSLLLSVIRNLLDASVLNKQNRAFDNVERRK